MCSSTHLVCSDIWFCTCIHFKQWIEIRKKCRIILLQLTAGTTSHRPRQTIVYIANRLKIKTHICIAFFDTISEHLRLFFHAYMAKFKRSVVLCWFIAFVYKYISNSHMIFLIYQYEVKKKEDPTFSHIHMGRVTVMLNWIHNRTDTFLEKFCWFPHNFLKSSSTLHFLKQPQSLKSLLL